MSIETVDTSEETTTVTETAPGEAPVKRGPGRPPKKTATTTAPRAATAPKVTPPSNPVRRFVDLKIEEIEQRIATNLEAIQKTSDFLQRQRLSAETRILQNAMKWVPDALTIPGEPVTFGCVSSRGLSLAMPAMVSDQKIRFVRHTYTTADPLTIARIRYHIRTNQHPVIEEIPFEYVPAFNQKNIFIAWVSREQYQELANRMAIKLNYE